MIVVTGAAGFIASCLVHQLNSEGLEDLILVDEFTHIEKNKNLEGKRFAEQVERSIFPDWLEKNAQQVSFVYHLGARTDTTEFDESIFEQLNVSYSKRIWQICTKHQIPLVYASSAATYGLGDLGFSDAHEVTAKYQPLNPYGWSKQLFDCWVLEQDEVPPFWAGLKFFNVYGPNEYHKGRMASVVMHAFNQIRKNGSMKLFRSHRPGVEDGHQSRDFIHVNDVVAICHFFLDQNAPSGIYNVGTGSARTFNELVMPIFKALQLKPNISYIDTPTDIRDTYQYFTQAEMQKLADTGYDASFIPIEVGVYDYVSKYLKEHKYR